MIPQRPDAHLSATRFPRLSFLPASSGISISNPATIHDTSPCSPRSLPSPGHRRRGGPAPAALSAGSRRCQPSPGARWRPYSKITIIAQTQTEAGWVLVVLGLWFFFRLFSWLLHTSLTNSRFSDKNGPQVFGKIPGRRRTPLPAPATTRPGEGKKIILPAHPGRRNSGGSPSLRAPERAGGGPGEVPRPAATARRQAAAPPSGAAGQLTAASSRPGAANGRPTPPPHRLTPPRARGCEEGPGRRREVEAVSEVPAGAVPAGAAPVSRRPVGTHTKTPKSRTRMPISIASSRMVGPGGLRQPRGAASHSPRGAEAPGAARPPHAARRQPAPPPRGRAAATQSPATFSPGPSIPPSLSLGGCPPLTEPPRPVGGKRRCLQADTTAGVPSADTGGRVPVTNTVSPPAGAGGDPGDFPSPPRLSPPPPRCRTARPGSRR